MDYTRNLGPCPKCGGGLFSKPILKPIIPYTSNYCSKCGKSLRSKCFSCNGTGRTIRLFDKYCSECGRELDNTCSSCNGTGEIVDSFHYCTGI